MISMSVNTHANGSSVGDTSYRRNNQQHHSSMSALPSSASTTVDLQEEKRARTVHRQDNNSNRDASNTHQKGNNLARRSGGMSGGSTNTSLSEEEDEEESGLDEKDEEEEEDIPSATASVGDVSAASSSNRHISSRFGPRLAPIGAEQISAGGSVADSLPGAGGGTATSSLSGGVAGTGGSLSSCLDASSVEMKLSRLKLLEEQQEDLNSSLLNLTSHFAQVQFRLKQIINAPPHVKQDLLAELEEFAGKGCVDTRHVKKSKESLVSLAARGAGGKNSQEDMSAEEHEAKIAEQKQKQQELISGTPTLCHENPVPSENEDSDENQMLDDDEDELFSDDRSLRCSSSSTSVVSMHSKFTMNSYELKEQLMELETFAYESGQGELPQSVLVEKQKAMIDQLRSRLNINLDDFDHLSTEELKKIVDSSLQRIINPAKAKEDLLYQLQSQISDLERFIDFLMAEGTVAPVGNQALCSCNRKCPVHNDHEHHCGAAGGESSQSNQPSSMGTTTTKRKFFNGRVGSHEEEKKQQQRQKQETYNTVKKTMYLIQMYLLANMSCVGGGAGAPKGGGSSRRHQTGAGSEMEMRSEKEEFDHQFKLKLNKLSKTVDTVIQYNSASCMDTDYFSDSSDTPSVLVNADLVKTVRRNLVYCLKELLQFAVVPSGGKESSSAVSPFNCFSGRSARLKRSSAALAAAHIWQLFLAYYEIKHGNDYVHTPARKLTDAFKLDSFGTDGRGNTSASSNCVVGGGGSTGTGSNNSSNIRSQAITAKQTLLTAIYDIVSTHEPLKRTFDSQFKAFVCRGLNEKRLALWFRLVLRTQEIVDRYYCSWNFMTKAYFDDITKLLEKFSQYNFNLPVNMAVQPIRNIKDAF